MLSSQGAHKPQNKKKKKKVLMSPPDLLSPGSTPELPQPSATSPHSKLGGKHQQDDDPCRDPCRDHLGKRAPRASPGSSSQRPAGAGGVLAQSPTITAIRSHLITALLSTTPSTGLPAAHRWENHPGCRKDWETSPVSKINAPFLKTQLNSKWNKKAASSL